MSNEICQEIIALGPVMFDKHCKEITMYCDGKIAEAPYAAKNSFIFVKMCDYGPEQVKKIVLKEKEKGEATWVDLEAYVASLDEKQIELLKEEIEELKEEME